MSVMDASKVGAPVGGCQRDGELAHPEDWGWRITGVHTVPVMTELEPAPKVLLEVIRCKCKAGCGKRCGCRGLDLECTPACGECRGICENMTKEDVDEKSNDLWNAYANWFVVQRDAAVNVNPLYPPGQAVDTKSTLGKKVVSQNSTLIHPGPQVNSTGIHCFSHKFSTLSKPFSIKLDENLARYSTPIVFLNDRNSTFWKHSIAQNSTPTWRLLGGDPWWPLTRGRGVQGFHWPLHKTNRPIKLS
jgi:hypothetical protein